MLLLRNKMEMINDLAHREALEVETLAARENGRQHLMYIGCCHHKNSMWRWFFQRFEQGIKCFCREHMSFVEDIDLVFAGGGGHHYFFAQFANAIDTAIGSRIDLNHIERIASGNLTTLLALVARLPVLWVCAVDGLGKEASHRGLAGAARPGEEIGMS